MTNTVKLAELTSDLRKQVTLGQPTCLERRALAMLEELGLERARVGIRGGPAMTTPTTPEACRAEQERVLTAEQTEMLHQIQGCAEVGDGHYHDAVTDGLILALAGAHAEALEREARLREIHQEKTKRLGSLRRYVWEQYRRKIPEMKDVGSDLDFILAMPVLHPETGEALTLDEALELAFTLTQETQQ